MKIYRVLLTLIIFTGLFLAGSLIGKTYAATFTIDSTGDAADAAIDGNCATAGAVCTLRAALAEANANSITDTIAFNIPTSDTGYRDYDNQGTASSGDSLGGDDYWTIQPASALPTITESGTTIDGATQTTNQGNTNTFGPEIEIRNPAAVTTGLEFSSSVTSGTLNSLVVNYFVTQQIRVAGTNITLTRNYIGNDPKGLTSHGGSYGILSDTTADNIIVGGSVAERNVISGAANNIHAECGTGGSGQNWIIKSNYIGTDPSGTISVPGGNGAWIHMDDECIALIGGDTPAEGNLISGGFSNNNPGMQFTLSSNAIPDIQIYNNLVGTDPTGTVKVGGFTLAINVLNTSAAGYDGLQNPVKIGDYGKGNLIRFAFGSNITFSHGRDLQIIENTITDWGDDHCCLDNISLGGGSGLTYDAIVDSNFICHNEVDPYFGVLTGTLNLPDVFGISTNAYESALNGLQFTNNIVCSDYTAIAATFSGSATGLTIDGNTFRNNLNEIRVDADNSTFTNNITHSTNSGTATIRTGVNFQNSFNDVIQNNQFYNCQGAGLRIAGTSDNIEVLDNLIYQNGTGGTSADFTLAGGVAGSYGTMVNDAGDVDTGNNDLMNWPEILNILYTGNGNYTISGRLDGNVAEAPFDIEVCESDDQYSGFGGCIDTLAHVATAAIPDETTVGGNTYFNWEANVNIPGSDGTDGRKFTALATQNGSSTSHFGTNIDTADPDAPYDFIDYTIELVFPIGGAEIDDTTPQFDWNASADGATVNPDVDHYILFLDGAEYAQTDDSVTEYQSSSPLTSGEHTWQVKAYDNIDVEIDSSVQETFIVAEQVIPPEPENYTFNLLYPVNITIDDQTPLFSWSEIAAASGVTNYKLYLNGNLLATLTAEVLSYQQIDDLSEGIYKWYVIALKDSETIYTTPEAQFTIELLDAVKPPITGKPNGGPKVINPPLPDFFSNKGFESNTLLPLGGIIVTGFLASLLLVIFTAAKELLERLGFLIGGIVPRKKKYWGIVFDAHKSQGVPFAIVRIYSTTGKLLTTTVTDVDGLYGVALDSTGNFIVEAKAKGFKVFKTKVTIRDLTTPEIILDIPLERLGKNLGILRILWFYYLPELIKLVRILILIIMFVGFFYSFYVFILFPILINLIIILVYFLLIIFNFWMEQKNKRNVEGKVVELKSHSGLGGTTVILFNSAGEQQDVRLTNKNGIAKLRAKHGSYKVQAHKNGYQMAELPEKQTSMDIKVDKRGYLSKAIFMREKP